jgi:hypothetical protein
MCAFTCVKPFVFPAPLPGVNPGTSRTAPDGGIACGSI